MKRRDFAFIKLIVIIVILTAFVIISIPTIIEIYNNNSIINDEDDIADITEKEYMSDIIKPIEKLDLSGKIQYCAILDSKGKIKDLRVSNGTWIAVLPNGKDISDLTKADLVEGSLDGYVCGDSIESIPKSFSSDSWEVIIKAVKSGNTGNYKVGETKEVNFGSKYGKHKLRIANMSTPKECDKKGFSQTACGFVLEFTDAVAIHEMNPAGEYNGTEYEYGHNIGGWPNTTLRTFVNKDIYNALPAALKKGIIKTKVVSSHGSKESNNFTSTDKLYLLAPTEIYSDWPSKEHSINDSAINLTRQLDYYKKKKVTLSNYAAAIKKYDLKESDYNMFASKGWTEEGVGYTTFLETYKTDMNESAGWWLRSAYSDDYDYFFGVNYGGDCDYGTGDSIVGVSPAFRIG